MLFWDWLILVIYIFIIVFLSYKIGKTQTNQDDYYLAGKGLKYWQIGGSFVANQVSAISLVGVPAFIALKQNGGLKWLQYELAVPLAMIFIIIFLVPAFWKYSKITIYEFLEKKFGKTTRSVLSLIFIVSRSLAAGVALLATSYVTAVCINLDIKITIIIIGFVALIYTVLGGLKADVYSDIIQLIVLWFSSFVCIFIILKLLNWQIDLNSVNLSRLKIFDLNSSGIGDGKTFSFFPMLFGGLFLYISYYGCDQSQAQRLLSSRSKKESKKALVFNSLTRFPLVVTYSMVGLLLLPFLNKFKIFAKEVQNLPPDYIMPVFFKNFMPPGILGIIVAGVFAASMSSLDSAINSLSAASWNDFLIKVRPSLNKLKDKKKVMYSKIITIFWGFLTTGFALYIANSSETVVELVNKIGSAFYGPIAAVFGLGLLSNKIKQKPAIIALFSGVFINIWLWMFFKSVSWLWWNVTGFFVTFFGALFLNSMIFSGMTKLKKSVKDIDENKLFTKLSVFFLIILFLIIILICILIEKILI